MNPFTITTDFFKQTTSKVTSLLVSAAFAFSLSAQAEIIILDRIVAVVDDTAITETQLQERVTEVVERSRASGMRLPPEDVLKEQIMDMLINETLQLNAAKRYGVSATDEDVERAIENILKRQKITRDQLKTELAKAGKTFNEFRETIRKQVTIQQITSGLVNSRIQISEQDVDSFLRSADAQFWASPDFHLGHILIPIPKSATFEQTQEAEAKANRIYQSLVDGADFAAIAIAESKGPAALKGGDIGWRKSSALPTLFAEIAPKLEVGQVAKPARSGAGFHILKLKDKRGEEKQMITQSKVSHILLNPNELLDDEGTKNKLLDIRTKINSGEVTFAEMAKEHTDDIATKLAGGDMGWSQQGMFVPEFEQVMLSIEENVISEPFQTQFGWHILVVEERREEDVTEDVRRMRAQNVIRSRRFEDELQIWVQEMRDQAFIDLRI